MLRAWAIVLIAASAVFIGLACRAGEAPVEAVEAPEVRGAPVLLAGGAAPEDGPRPGARSEIRIGDFERPEEVPEYEIIEERGNERDGARGAWLLVETRSDSQEEYVLITRDIKARYAYLDAVSVEFIDLARALRYSGGALIFNTAAGVDYMGLVYGPPNNKGYYVRAND